MFDDLSSDIFLRCQSRIQHVFDEHKSRVMNLEKLKAEGGITTDYVAASTPASQILSRLDSPDTTDSSRPDTGNNPLKNSQQFEHSRADNSDTQDVSLHCSHPSFISDLVT